MASLFGIARSLEGLTRHASTHAAGVVMSNKSLMEYLPLYRGQAGEVMTQYAMKEVESIGQPMEEKSQRSGLYEASC